MFTELASYLESGFTRAVAATLNSPSMFRPVFFRNYQPSPLYVRIGQLSSAHPIVRCAHYIIRAATQGACICTWWLLFHTTHWILNGSIQSFLLTFNLDFPHTADHDLMLKYAIQSSNVATMLLVVIYINYQCGQYSSDWFGALCDHICKENFTVNTIYHFIEGMVKMVFESRLFFFETLQPTKYSISKHRDRAWCCLRGDITPLIVWSSSVFLSVFLNELSLHFCSGCGWQLWFWNVPVRKSKADNCGKTR